MAVFNYGVTKDRPAYSLRDQVPVPQRSVVSFVDILGYSAKVADAAESGKSNEFLFDFRQALFAASEYLEADAPCYAFNFTDSVVVGWPIIAAVHILLESCDISVDYDPIWIFRTGWRGRWRSIF